jgi:hypothetical protein
MSYFDAPSKIDLTGVESSELLDNEHLNQHDWVVFLCLFERMFSARFSSFFKHQNDQDVISFSLNPGRGIAETSNKIKIKKIVYVLQKETCGVSPFIVTIFFKYKGTSILRKNEKNFCNKE